jgi:hypothetical protein
MTDFEEWWDDVGHNLWCNDDEMFLVDFVKVAWEQAFEEGYKFANKENEEYEKTLTGDSAV